MSESASSRRVVVTGMGVISPIGFTLDELWNACRNRVNGVVPYEVGGSEPIPIKYAAPVTSFTGDVSHFGDLDGSLKKDVRKSLKLMSREIQMGVASAQRALQNAQIHSGLLNPYRVGVSFGADYIVTTLDELVKGVESCQNGNGFDFSRWPADGMTKMSPLWQLKFLTNMITSHISILNQFYGVGCNITNREASIGALVGEAAEIVKSGKVDVMVVGATGSRLHPLRLISAILNETVALDETVSPSEASRPFDRDRIGSVLGEGSGTLVIEDADHARRRGVKIYAEIVGGTDNCVLTRSQKGQKEGRNRYFDYESAENITESLTLSLRTLFAKTGRRPESIGHINAQGQATPIMDAAESAAIRGVFGESAKVIPTTTIKGHIGNSGAGGGAIDLIASIIALEKEVLFPILNNKTDDPACPIRPVREDDVPAGDSFVKTACHPLGQTSALLVSRYAD